MTKIDLRTKAGRAYKLEAKLQRKKEFRQWMISAVALGFLAGAVLTSTLWQAFNRPKVTPEASPEPLKQTIEVKAVEIPCDYDPITYIRCSGEKLGKDNQTIMTMIRIAKAESGLRPDAIHYNNNGTYDIGVFQINDVHSKSISRADRFDYVKNIDYAWELQTRQGFNPWVVYTKGIVK